MEKKYEDLITQANYARFKGLTRARICQKVKNGSLNTIWIGGVKLVKLSADELVDYKAFLLI